MVFPVGYPIERLALSPDAFISLSPCGFARRRLLFHETFGPGFAIFEERKISGHCSFLLCFALRLIVDLRQVGQRSLFADAWARWLCRRRFLLKRHLLEDVAN